jgi:hypothetical protein
MPGVQTWDITIDDMPGNTSPTTGIPDLPKSDIELGSLEQDVRCRHDISKSTMLTDRIDKWAARLKIAESDARRLIKMIGQGPSTQTLNRAQYLSPGGLRLNSCTLSLGRTHE